MTFDDGLVSIYKVVNIGDAGDIPREGLTSPISLHFSEETLGISRFYEALKAEQLIERVISTYLEPGVTVNDIAVFEDGEQYIVRMIQRATDSDGIKIMRLSLERKGEAYEIIS